MTDTHLDNLLTRQRAAGAARPLLVAAARIGGTQCLSLPDDHGGPHNATINRHAGVFSDAAVA